MHKQRFYNWYFTICWTVCWIEYSHDKIKRKRSRTSKSLNRISSSKEPLLIWFERAIVKCRRNEVESVHLKVAAIINTLINIWASSASRKISNGMAEHFLNEIYFHRFFLCWKHFTNSSESQFCNESFQNALDRFKLHHEYTFNGEKVNFYWIAIRHRKECMEMIEKIWKMI